MLSKLNLFRLASAKQDWLETRQNVLARNLANADTPDYRPQDVKRPDFARMLEGDAPGRALDLARTAPDHVTGDAAKTFRTSPGDAYEIAPSGNAVVIEEQVAKISGVASEHKLATSIYRKYLGMMRMALGTGQN